MSVTTQDLGLILFLAFLEGILSVDNALVLAMMARHLPPAQQRRALTYGLIGAVGFRLVALSLVTRIIQMTWVKVVGGGYLLFVALKHFVENRPHAAEKKAVRKAGFWRTVVYIELMDIAFAVDSILAAVAVSQKLWIVFIGGMMGVILMRFAASGFLKLLARFPGFETSAYLLVGTIGGKLCLEAMRIPGVDFHSSHNAAFWVFWTTMALWCVLPLVDPRRRKDKSV